MKLQGSAGVYQVLEVESVTTVCQVSMLSHCVENVTVIGMVPEKKSVTLKLVTVSVRAMWSAHAVISVMSTPMTLTLGIPQDVHSVSALEIPECARNHL